MGTYTEPLWDSRFDDTDEDRTEDVAAITRKFDQDEESILGDVLLSVRNEITHIPSAHLTLEHFVGRGNSFQVTKERYTQPSGFVYYVAVKRVIVRQTLGDTQASAAQLRAASGRLRDISREIRVLTHRALESHPCLVSAMGWGSVVDRYEVAWPYLVTAYSPCGSLDSFAQGRDLNVVGKRWLALDMALALRAVHDAKFVHGDVKPANVLVFDYVKLDHEKDGPVPGRSYLAKLGDLGCSFFEHDVNHLNESYLGTPRYNAPEISRCFKDEDRNNSEVMDGDRFARFQAADCYSFGLLLWEILKQGKSFVEPEWLRPGEGALDFLKRSFSSKENALLELATGFLDCQEAYLAATQGSREATATIRGENNGDKRATDARSFEVFRGIMRLCLQDVI